MIPLWLLMAGSAALGAKNQNDLGRQQHAQAMAEAAKTQYSPWTGMGAGQTVPITANPLGGALSGALAGLSFGQQFKPGENLAVKHADQGGIPDFRRGY